MPSQSTKRTADNNVRAAQWNAGGVTTLRNDLHCRIAHESEIWKAEKARKDAEAGVGSANGTTKDEKTSTPETDDEVVVQEIVTNSPVVKGGKGRKEYDKHGEMNIFGLLFYYIQEGNILTICI